MRMIEDYLRTVSTSGFVTISVGDNPPVEGVAAFSYTIGLERSLNHPELIFIGLPPEYAHQYFWYAFHAIGKAGFRFEAGQQLNAFECDYPMTVVECDAAAFETHLIQAQEFYRYIEWRQPIRALQLVICDKSSRFPWDQGFDLSIEYRKLLGKFNGVKQQVAMEAVLELAKQVALQRSRMS